MDSNVRRSWTVAALLTGAIVVVAWTVRNSGPHAHASTAETEPPVLAHLQRMRSPHREAPNVARDALPTSATASLSNAPVLSLTELSRTKAQDRALWNAEEKLVASCMKARGFDYETNPPDMEADTLIAAQRVPRGDVEQARQVGYGFHRAIVQGELPRQDIDANAELLAGLSDERRRAFREALAGPPIPPNDPSMAKLVDSVPLPGGAGTAYWYRDSCVARARRELFGHDDVHNEIGFSRNELQAELEQELENDPQYKAALASWQGCMQQKGFDYPNPRSISDSLNVRFQRRTLPLEELKAEELTLATADAACDGQAKLEANRKRAHDHAEQALLDRRQEMLQLMKRERSRSLVRALAVLEEEPE